METYVPAKVSVFIMSFICSSRSDGFVGHLDIEAFDESFVYCDV